MVGAMARLRLAWILLPALAFSSCSRLGDSPFDADEDRTDVPPPPSDNVIDVAIWPRMVAAGATDIRWADGPELCRRLFLDLVGAIPTPAEYAETCDGQSAAAIADALMASPRFVVRERRLWIQELRE